MKLQAEIKKIAGQVVVDPDAENRARLRKLVTDEAGMQAAIKQASNDLVAPGQMISMLEAIMARQGKLQLVSLTKLPIQSVSTSTPQAPALKAADGQPAPIPAKTTAVSGAQAADVVYKHGVEIVVEGGYQELMEYVAQLEQLPMRVVWGNLKLSVNGYPLNTMSLTMYTLSLEKKWLDI